MMKHMRKVLALMLIFSMVLGMYSVTNASSTGGTVDIAEGVIKGYSEIDAKMFDPLYIAQLKQGYLLARAEKKHYEYEFNLSDLTGYTPTPGLSGNIMEYGSKYVKDSGLHEAWETVYKEYQPNITFDTSHLTHTNIGMMGLSAGLADIAQLGRDATWDDIQVYQAMYAADPIEIIISTGSFNVSGWTFAHAIFVNKDNPVPGLTMQNLDGIFGEERNGGWRDIYYWNPSAARSADLNIRYWGQVPGMTGGEWTNRKINLHIYNQNYHFPPWFAKFVLGGSTKWNNDAKDYVNYANEAGTGQIVAGQQMVDVVGRELGGITYTGILYATDAVRDVPIAYNENTPFVPLTLQTAQDRSYPLYREINCYIHGDENKMPVNPLCKDFLSFVLSREGQTIINANGKYLPLTRAVQKEQLEKLGIH